MNHHRVYDDGSNGWENVPGGSSTKKTRSVFSANAANWLDQVDSYGDGFQVSGMFRKQVQML